MPDRELVLRTRCEHGHSFGPHHGARSKTEEEFNAIVGVEDCPGGSETVLDPERWLRLYCRLTGKPILVKVQDVLDALGGSDE